MADETRLVAVFDADVSRFSKGMDDAKNYSDKFFTNLQNKMQQTEQQTTSGLGSIGNALSKFLSVAAIEEFSRHVVTMTAGLIDQAKVLNVNIEQLQTFRELLKDAGGTAEDADTILKRLTATIGAAQLEGAKGGPAQDIFAHLGLGPGDLQGDTVDVLQRVAKALLAIPDATIRARLEVEAFGRSGQEFERVLTQVAAGLGPYTEKLKEANRITDDGSAQRAKEALDELSKAWSQLETSAAGPLSLIISDLASIVELIGKVTSSIPAMGKALEGAALGAAAGSVVPGIGTLGGAAAGAVVGGIYGLTNPSGAAAGSAAAAGTAQAGAAGGGAYQTQQDIANAKIRDQLGAVEKAALSSAGLSNDTKSLQDALRAMKELNDGLNAFRKQAGDTIDKAFEEAQKAARQAVNETKDDAAQAADQLSVAQNQANVDRLQGTEKVFDAERTLALDETNAQIAEIERRRVAQRAAYADQLTDAVAFAEAVANVDAAANADKAAAQLKFLSQLAQIEEAQTGALHDSIQAADGLRSALTDVGVAASHGFTSFRDAAAQALRQVADMIIQLEVMKPLVNSLFGSQGTTLGGSIGGFLSDLLQGFPSSVNITPGFFGAGHATGGPVQAGVAYPVGEKGPELFMPSVPGVIVPNGGKSGSPTTLNWSITVKGTTDKELLAQVNSGVAQMMTAYDRNLPRRVQQISNDPFLMR